MLSEFRGTEHIILTRHPEYYLSPRPWLDDVRYTILTDPQAHLEAFDSRQIDVFGAILSLAEAEERRTNENMVVSESPARFYPVIHFNIRQQQDISRPFEDIRVREAFDLALDRRK